VDNVHYRHNATNVYNAKKERKESMSLTKVASTDFHQRTGEFVDKAMVSPIAITKRGRPSLVLMSFDEYQRLTGLSRRALKVTELNEEQLKALSEAEVPKEFDHLNRELDE
jgi:prevent-host-death family protein